MRKLTTLLVSFTVTACGTKLPGGFTVPGGGGSSSGGGTAAAPAGGTAGTPAAPPGPAPVIGDLGPYYASLEHTALRELFKNAARDDIYEKAKADVGRDALWQSANPDPAWIKDWGQRDWTNASENAEVMYQAAYNRSWETACATEADATRAAHAKLAEAHGGELARVDGLTNYYERMAGYAALYASYEAAAATAGLAPDQAPLGPVGFRVDILAHAIAYHQGSTHGFLEFPWARFGAAAERTRRDGRTLTTDAAFERQAYCSAASSSGGRALAPFTSIIDGSNTKARKLAWPTVWGDEKAVNARVKTLRAETSASLATRGGARTERVEKSYGVSFPEGDPKLALFQGFEVVSVSGATLKLARTDFETYDYNCRETTKIDRIENGRIKYRLDCKTGKSTWDLVAEATFPELPPGLTLAKGDVLHFHADLESSTLKKLKDTAAQRHTRRTLVLTGRHLGGVTRGKEKLSW